MLSKPTLCPTVNKFMQVSKHGHSMLRAANPVCADSCIGYQYYEPVQHVHTLLPSRTKDVVVTLELQEKSPMGTAGPLALARAILDDGSKQPFFVLNRYSSV